MVGWLTDGWQVFAADPGDWVNHAAPLAEQIAMTQARRHGETWVAGVDALPNDADGAVSGGPPLICAALQAAQAVTGPLPLHLGQVSGVFPGYPGRDADETDAAHRFRLNRDAAHLDGLLPIGPDRRRYLREPHGWILGLPVTDMPSGAAPPVVYAGSHHVMRDAMRAVLQGHPPADWPGIDLTEAYQTARRAVLADCPRVVITASPGQSFLIHRLAIHGIASWTGAANGWRGVVYFRPQLAAMTDWLDLP